MTASSLLFYSEYLTEIACDILTKYVNCCIIILYKY